MKITARIVSVVKSRGWKNEAQAIINLQTDGAPNVDMHLYVPRSHPMAKVMREGVTIQVGPAV